MAGPGRSLQHWTAPAPAPPPAPVPALARPGAAPGPALRSGPVVRAARSGERSARGGRRGGGGEEAEEEEEERSRGPLRPAAPRAPPPRAPRAPRSVVAVLGPRSLLPSVPPPRPPHPHLHRMHHLLLQQLLPHGGAVPDGHCLDAVLAQPCVADPLLQRVAALPVAAQPPAQQLQVAQPQLHLRQRRVPAPQQRLHALPEALQVGVALAVPALHALVHRPRSAQLLLQRCKRRRVPGRLRAQPLQRGVKRQPRTTGTHREP